MTQQRCYYHPLRRIRTHYSVGAKNISTVLGCRIGRHAVQPVQRAGVLTSVREGCVSFFSVPLELYQRSSQLYQPVLSAMLPASEQKRSYAINCGTGHRVS